MVWIMSIVGISALGILLDVLLPEGETNKYIKGVFAVFTVLVIISPLPSLIGNGFDFNGMFGKEAPMKADEAALTEIRRMQEEERENICKNDLETIGFKNLIVSVTMEREKNEIKKVFVDFSNAVIAEEIAHIDIKDKVNEYFKKRWSLSAERVNIWNLKI